ncbi:hypothetical protein HCN44_004781 [Aphidius gifuensis]|uniref:Regulation of nuclear pre-mRNA domain-containing protein 2 n=1 Tax=Aphidius gifuensis TaxID=684658 RepID=A0A835CPC9_APHGI|nr:uncharacterized protein LOC122859588 [Aphidius gifuensis]KAF7987965.1 hypothetical protein HCN44_004781 [Aphidius gifuensis]
MASSEFDSEQFEKRLHGLKDSQESIQSLSSWCLERRIHHKKIVATWLQVLRKVKVEHRLTLFYLANDVIQYSKRKNYEFVESWGTTLQRATTLVRDEKVKHRILRIFKIWDQRQVYDEEFLTDLSGLISAAPKKKVELQPTNALEEFQPTFLISTMRSCSALEQTTDLRLQEMRDNNIDIDNSEELCVSLKDRRKVKKAEKEVDLAVKNVENYICALESEIRERIQVLDLLEQADQYYETQRSEVKIVTNAYRNFGSRVKTLKKKLDELLPTLSSPIPSPDINAPSPSPDSDIELPDEDHNQSSAIEIAPPLMYGSYSQDYEPMPVPPPDILEKNNSTDFTSNFSSFMGTNVDFDMRNLFSNHSVTPISDRTYNKAMPIEVINMRPSKTNGGEEFNSNFIKNVFSTTDTAQLSSGIPGLGLDVPEPRIESPQRPDYSQLLPSTQINNSTTTSRIMAVHGLSHTAIKNLTSHSAPLSHVLLSYSNENNQNNIMPFEKSSPNTNNPLPPPPLPPPIFLDNDGCYNKLPPKFPTWTSINEGKNLNSSWSSENVEHDCWESRNDENWSNGIQRESCLSETPDSPPIYEKSSFCKPVQYNDSQTEDEVLKGAADVDHRVILIPVPSEDQLPHRLMKGADVDHRNLISLTGSPANNAANTNEAPESNINTLWTITDQDYRRPVQLGDIVESVDMEMSDDETDGVKQKSRILVDLRSQDKDMRAGVSQQTSRQMDLEMNVVSVNHGQISNNVQESFPPLSLQPCQHSQSDFAPNRDDFRQNNQELPTDQENFRPDISSSAFMKNQPAFTSEFSVPPEFHHPEIYDFSNNQQQSRTSGKKFHDELTAPSRYLQSQEHLHLQQQHHHHHHHRETTVFHRGRGRFLRNRRDRFNENCNSRRYRRQDQLENNAENITSNQATFLQPPETCVIYDDNGIPIMPDSTLDEILIQNKIINETESEKSENVDTENFETDEQIPELKVLVNSKEIACEDRFQENSAAQAEEPSQNLSEHFEALMNSGKTTGDNELTRQSTNGDITDQKDENVCLPSKTRSLLQNGPSFPSLLATNELHPVIIYDYENQHVTSPNFRPRLSSPVTGSICSPRRGSVLQPHGRGNFRGSPRVSWTDRGSRGPPTVNYMSRGNNRGSLFWGSGNFSGGASGFRGRGRGTNTW